MHTSLAIFEIAINPKYNTTWRWLRGNLVTRAFSSHEMAGPTIRHLILIPCDKGPFDFPNLPRKIEGTSARRAMQFESPLEEDLGFETGLFATWPPG